MANGQHDSFAKEVDYVFKVVVLDEDSVGKTQLFTRFCRNEFGVHNAATIGLDFLTRTVVVDNSSIKAYFWDTAGQERFRSITRTCYKGAVGAVLVYDITKQLSFDRVQWWLEELRVHADINVVIMLIGNKSDLSSKRQVDTDQAQELAEKAGLPFFETSALDLTNVETAFSTVLSEIYKIVSKKALIADESRGSPPLLS